MLPDYSELAREDFTRLRRAKSELRLVVAEADKAELCRKLLVMSK